MAKKPEPYIYGRSRDPRNWYEAADALKSNIKAQAKPRKNTLMQRLEAVEQKLGERK